MRDHYYSIEDRADGRLIRGRISEEKDDTDAIVLPFAIAFCYCVALVTLLRCSCAALPGVLALTSVALPC